MTNMTRRIAILALGLLLAAADARAGCEVSKIELIKRENGCQPGAGADHAFYSEQYRVNCMDPCGQPYTTSWKASYLCASGGIGSVSGGDGLDRLEAQEIECVEPNGGKSALLENSRQAWSKFRKQVIDTRTVDTSRAFDAEGLSEFLSTADDDGGQDAVSKGSAVITRSFPDFYFTAYFDSGQPKPLFETLDFDDAEGSRRILITADPGKHLPARRPAKELGLRAFRITRRMLVASDSRLAPRLAGGEESAALLDQVRSRVDHDVLHLLQCGVDTFGNEVPLALSEIRKDVRSGKIEEFTQVYRFTCGYRVVPPSCKDDIARVEVQPVTSFSRVINYGTEPATAARSRPVPAGIAILREVESLLSRKPASCGP